MQVKQNKEFIHCLPLAGRHPDFLESRVSACITIMWEDKHHHECCYSLLPLIPPFPELHCQPHHRAEISLYSDQTSCPNFITSQLTQTPRLTGLWQGLEWVPWCWARAVVKKGTSNPVRPSIISTPYFMLFVLCPGPTLHNTSKQSLTTLLLVIPDIPLYQHNMFSTLTPYTLHPSIRIIYSH